MRDASDPEFMVPGHVSQHAFLDALAKSAGPLCVYQQVELEIDPQIGKLVDGLAKEPVEGEVYCTVYSTRKERHYLTTVNIS